MGDCRLVQVGNIEVQVTRSVLTGGAGIAAYGDRAKLTLEIDARHLAGLYLATSSLLGVVGQPSAVLYSIEEKIANEEGCFHCCFLHFRSASSFPNESALCFLLTSNLFVLNTASPNFQAVGLVSYMGAPC